MATRDQARAALAWKHVEAVGNESTKLNTKRYGAMVHGLPALIRNAGLSQALHFILSRQNPESKRLLDHLAEQLAVVDGSLRTAKEPRRELLRIVREATVERYLRLTQEALACITWYKRLVKGVLNVDASEDGE